MANLQKIVKVTQAQYNTLASGGTVGSYTGLNDNYIYLIEDSTEYLPTTGGEIVNNGYIEFYDSNNDFKFGLNDDGYGDEIIYLATSSYGYMPLFADDSGAIISSNNGDYHQDITLDTDFLKINHTSQGSSVGIYGNGTILFTDTNSDVWYIDLPQDDGTLALTSDLTNYVTLDTAQTITGLKTFGSNGFKINNVVFSGSDANLNYARVGNFYMYTNGSMVTYSYGVFDPGTSAIYNLGDSTHLWQDLYLSRNLTDGTNSITVANIVAKQDAVQVKRYI